MKVVRVGLDLAKKVFAVHGVDAEDSPVLRKTLRRDAVPPKSSEQLEIQAVHRIRQRLVSDRTRLVNQIRGLLAEHGVVIGRDISLLRRGFTQIIDGAVDGLGDLLLDLVRDVHQELAELDQRIARYNQRILHLFRTNQECQRIGQIEGIGPITATALVAAVGEARRNQSGLAATMYRAARKSQIYVINRDHQTRTNQTGAIRRGSYTSKQDSTHRIGRLYVISASFLRQMSYLTH